MTGHDVSRSHPRQVRRLLGLAPQVLALYPTATALENLLVFAGLYGMRRRDALRRIDELAEALVLGDFLHRRARDLSGGQQRRLQAATAMIHRPRLLLLDEPTVGADPITRESLLAVVRSAADDGAGVVYTTHYLPELDVLDATVAVADHGRIVARGGSGGAAGHRARSCGARFRRSGTAVRHVVVREGPDSRRLRSPDHHLEGLGRIVGVPALGRIPSCPDVFAPSNWNPRASTTSTATW